MNFTNRLDALIHALNAAKQSDLDIERMTGIARTQVFRWRSGQTKNVQQGTFDKVMQALGIPYSITPDGIEFQPHTEDNNMNNKIIIENQQELIVMLKEKIKKLESRTAVAKPACDFRIKTELYTDDDLSPDDAWNDRKLIKSNMRVNGDTSVWGYTIKEVELMSIKDFTMAYHPESLKEAITMKNLLRDTENDMVHLRGLRTMKHKDGHWVNFMIEYIFERNPAKGSNAWDAVSYFQHLNGDQTIN